MAEVCQATVIFGHVCTCVQNYDLHYMALLSIHAQANTGSEEFRTVKISLKALFKERYDDFKH